MSGDTRYEDVSAADPCRCCGKPDWCSRRADGAVEYCRRHGGMGWAPKTDKNGQSYWVRVNKADVGVEEPPPDAPVRGPLADASTCDRGYAAMRAALGPRLLSEQHRDQLRRRGFHDEQIGTFGYATIPTDPIERRRVALHVEGVLGPEALTRVPGFYRHDSDLVPNLAAPGGLCVPVRDVDGRVIACRVRVVDRDGEKEHKRYLYLSAPNRPGIVGTGPGSQIHVPLHSAPQRDGVVRITEGEIKADLATLLSGTLTIGLPGVGAHTRALPVLQQLKVRRVLIALDRDARTNRHVAHALQRLAVACAAAGYDVAVEEWPERWKGIDDALADPAGGRAALTVYDGHAAWKKIEEIVAASGTELEPSVPARATLAGLPARLGTDPNIAAFAEDVLAAAAVINEESVGEYESIASALRKAGVRLAAWQRAVRRAGRKTVATPPRTLRREDLPEIVIRTDESAVVDETLAALGKHPDLYQRGGVLVQIVRDAAALRGITRTPNSPRIVEVAHARLRELCAESARWVEIRQDADGNDVKVDAHPPRWAVEAVQARGQWGFRQLAAITETPVLCSDGTVLDTPGYDEASGLYYVETACRPIVPARPTQDDARAAAAVLLDAFVDFPFCDEHHRAACIAAVVTPFARFAFVGPSPLNLIDANVRGAGKSLLSDVFSLIVAGRPMPRMAPSPDDAEERKRITALVLSGTSLVLIDNVTGALGTASLDAALTATEWRDRILGVSREVVLPIAITWYATGNNVQLVGDTSRRCLHIRLESPEERPEEREGFRHDPLLPWVREHRSQMVAAVLTILRAYCLAGRPDMKLAPWGSFDDWSRLVRHALVWAGLPDPGETRRELQAEADTAAVALPDLVTGWEEVAAQHGGACTAAQALSLLERDDALPPQNRTYQRLRGALDELVHVAPGQLPKAKQIGAVLRRYKGRVVRDKAIVKAGDRGEAGNLWRVVRVTSPRARSAIAAAAASEGTPAHTGADATIANDGAVTAVAEPAAPDGDAANAANAGVHAAPSSELKIGGLVFVDQPGGLAMVAACIAAASSLGLDFETTGLDPILDRPRLLQLATPDGQVFVLDLFATGGLGPVADALRAAEVVGHHLAFDLAFLDQHYGVTPRAVWCTLTASKLLGGGLDLRTRGAHTLQALAAKHLGVALPKDAQKSDWSGALTRAQVEYAARDALAVLRLRAILEPALAADGLTEVAALEFNLIRGVVTTTLAGLGFDERTWFALVERRRAEGQALHNAVQALLGVKNLNSQPQLLAALRGLGLDIASTDAAALAEHAPVVAVEDHVTLADRLAALTARAAETPLSRAQLGVVLAALVRARKLLAFANGPGAGIVEALRVHADGRVHAHFDPLAAPTGRLGCREPNLLALEKSHEVRRCVVPAPGCVFVVADYAAIELRVLAQVTGDPLLIEIFQQGRDPHRETAALVTGRPLVDITDAERTRAKAVNFGFAFGMGAKTFVKYARDGYGVELSEAEAVAIRAEYLRGYGGVARWQRRMRDAMPLEVRSASGRVRRFADRRQDYCERLNMGIQGTAADGHKYAMTLLDARLPKHGARLLLSVHDENVVETPEANAEAVRQLVVGTMVEGMAWFVPDVPIVVEADIRRTWAKEKRS